MSTPTRSAAARRPNESPAPKRAASVVAIVATATAAQFVLVLNTSIVNVALPGMHADLGLSVGAQQWVINGFLVTFGGFLLLAARVGDRFGEKAVISTGLVALVLASLAGGLAQSPSWLLAARFAQGLGAAGVAPATISLIVKTPMAAHHRVRSLALWSVASSAGGGAGLVLGGALTSWLGWRWVLLVDIPLGIALLIAAAQFLAPRTARASAEHGLDVPGAIAVTLGAVALIYGLSASGVNGWFSSNVIAALVAAVLLLVVFAVLETRSAYPLVPLRIFRHRPLTIANLLMVTVGITLTSSLYFLSLYEEQVLGYSPFVTGLSLAPMNVLFIVGGLTSRSLMSRFGPRTMLIVGALVAAAGMAWSAGIGVDSAYATSVLGPTLLIGAGLSIMFVPVVTAATIGIDHQHVGVASGLVNTSRQIGGAIGLAVLVTVSASITQAIGSGGTPGVVVGYRVAFVIAAAISVAAAALAAFLPAKPAPSAPANSAATAGAIRD